MAGRKKNLLLGVAILTLVVLMFSFAYANVPLFKLFCQRFGLGGAGKAGSEEGATPSSATGPVTMRFITVRFMGTSASGLPIRFAPSTPAVTTHPGRPVHLDYTFVNMSDDSVFFRAVHSISPLEAAREFQLMQCFCFEDQSMGPRETRALPVYFALSPRTPSTVHEVVLSYQLFPRDPKRALPVPAKEAN
ncbi:MAG TPA: cytochrome c oxidase assembly protein [Candidatus Eisenbacteria bacterium]|jgi:cytochrome c oxidase assembly protein subunit 11